jgi:hypothetical protein
MRSSPCTSPSAQETAALHPLAAEYLERLRRAGRGLPPGRRPELLWTSRAWSTRDKWIGTLVIPGGLATSVIVGLIAIGESTKNFCTVSPGGQRCTPAPGQSTPSSALGVAAFVLLVLAPIASAIYLARRAAWLSRVTPA